MATPTINLLPGKLNIKVSRGDTDGIPIGFTVGNPDVPEDLTGRTYRAQLRRTPNASTAIDVEVDTTEAASGILILRLDPVVSETLRGEYVWDLEENNGGTIRTRVAGAWLFDPDVTHD